MLTAITGPHLARQHAKDCKRLWQYINQDYLEAKHTGPLVNRVLCFWWVSQPVKRRSLAKKRLNRIKAGKQYREAFCNYEWELIFHKAKITDHMQQEAMKP